MAIDRKNIECRAFTYIDLFAGCGGLSLGLHNAGWKGIFAIEKNADAFRTLKHNLIIKKNHFSWCEWLPMDSMDINDIFRNFKSKLHELSGSIDMVVGGPPCQGFSSAGRRDEGDLRNKLVKSYIDFIRLVQPKVLFFENVKGFTQGFNTQGNSGKNFANYVHSALTRAGYVSVGKLINFGEYGIPQNRTRYVLVGIRKDISEVIPNFANNFFIQLETERDQFLQKMGLTKDINLKDAISDLHQSHGTYIKENSLRFLYGYYSAVESPYQNIMRCDVATNAPDSHRFANHKETTKSKYLFIIDNASREKGYANLIQKKFQIKKHSLTLLDKSSKCPTITTLPDDYIHYCEPRILTVREYARIQGFPDWYEFKGKYTTGGKKRVNEVPRYSQIGNAIPPLFAEQVGLVLIKLLSNYEKQ